MTESHHDERQRPAPAPNGSRVWTAITLAGLAALAATTVLVLTIGPYAPF